MTKLPDFLETKTMLQRWVDSGELRPAYECLVRLAIDELEKPLFMRKVDGLCSLCGDAALHDHLDAEREKWKLRKRKERSKK